MKCLPFFVFWTKPRLTKMYILFDLPGMFFLLKLENRSEFHLVCLTLFFPFKSVCCAVELSMCLLVQRQIGLLHSFDELF